MPHSNEDLLRQAFGAFSTGDVDAFAALLTDDVVFHFPGRGPMAGDHHGKHEVLATLGKQAELTAGTFRVELHDLLANDEHGVSLVMAKAERAGRAWQDNGVLVFHFRDGKLSEFWLHPGDLYAADEFFTS